MLASLSLIFATYCLVFSQIQCQYFHHRVLPSKSDSESTCKGQTRLQRWIIQLSNRLWETRLHSFWGASPRKALSTRALSPRSGRQRCRPFHGLRFGFVWLTWGLRPRLYAFTCFAGSEHNMLLLFAAQARRNVRKGRGF